MAPAIPSLEAEQITFLSCLYKHYHDESEWPAASALKRSLVQDGLLPVWRAGERIANDYLLWNADAGRAVALRVPGLVAAAPDCEEVRDFIAVLQLSVKRYREPGAPQRLELADLAALDINGKRLDRFNLLFERSEFVLGPQIRGDDVHYDISDDVDQYLDVTSIEDFIDVVVSRRNGRSALTVNGLGEEASLTARLPRLARAQDERSTVGIWKPDRLRVFISHTSAHRREVGELATVLDAFGLTCFVAHDAIEPTREWQATIEDALATMDAMVAYVTPDFHKSLWTDQEVGWALSRPTLIVSVNAGANPYGFFGAFQALQFRDADVLAEEVVRALATAVFRRQRPGAERFDEAMVDVVVEVFCVSHTFDTTRRRFPLLQVIPASAWRTDNFMRLRTATKENSQISAANLVGERSVLQAIDELIADVDKRRAL